MKSVSAQRHVITFATIVAAGILCTACSKAVSPSENSRPTITVEKSPEVLWTVRATSSANPRYEITFVRSIAADVDGNSYFFGPLRGKATLNGQDVTEETEGLPNVLVKISPDGHVVWLERLGVGPLHSFIASSPKGGLVLVGDFIETANIGGNKIHVGPMGSIVIAKFGLDGHLLWHKEIDTQRDGLLPAEALATGGNGSIIVGGSYLGKILVGTNSLNNADENKRDLFLASYSSDGEITWVTAIRGSGQNAITRIACDSGGNSYVAGYFKQSIDLGTNHLTSSGDKDVFVAKLNSTGTVVWAKSFGGKLWDQATAIAVDLNSNCYITGLFADQVLFGEVTNVAAGEQDIFLCKLNKEGKWDWVRTFGTPNTEETSAIALNQKSGHIYLAGNYGYALPMLALTNNTGFQKRFLVGLNAEGVAEWSKTFDYGGSDRLPIALDGAGNIFTSGSFDGVQTNRITPISFITKLGFAKSSVDSNTQNGQPSR